LKNEKDSYKPACCNSAEAEHAFLFQEQLQVGIEMLAFETNLHEKNELLKMK
jgi:hypothetical protein